MRVNIMDWKRAYWKFDRKKIKYTFFRRNKNRRLWVEKKYNPRMNDSPI